MAEAGVAVKFEKEMMFGKEGKITDDPNKMYGRPSKYMITRPDLCVLWMRLVAIQIARMMLTLVVNNM
jgi:hypothetical protein